MPPDVTSLLLTSWDRQCQIIDNLAGLVTEEVRHAKPSADGMPLDEQLAHIHEVRWYWLGMVSKEHREGLGDTYKKVGEKYVPINDLDEIKRQIRLSAAAVRKCVSDQLAEGKGEVGPYTSPVMFLQHMLWHDGYHFALILLGLRIAGVEPGEEWEEKNVWGIWRAYG